MADGAFNRHMYWQCPFFKWDGKMEVSCEGGRVKFPEAEDAKGYFEKYCAGDWKNCSIARMLNQYYDREE